MNLRSNWFSVLPFLSIGFASQIIQVVLLREFLIIFYGTELTVAIVFGCWLLGTGVGSALAGLFSKFLKKPFSLFLLSTFITCILAVLEVFIIKDIPKYAQVATGDYVSFSALMLSSLLLLVPLCVFIGAQFVFAVKTTGEISQIYAIEAIGSTLAGILVSFIFIPLLNTFALIFVTITVYTICALMLAKIMSNISLRFTLAGFVFIIVVFILSLFFADELDRVANTRYWKNFGEKFTLVETKNSPYGNIAVLEYQGQFSLYQSGRHFFDMPDRGEIAPIANLIMLQHPNPKKILLIGGGVAGFLKNILRHNIESVDYVELDADVIRVARKYISHEDADALLNSKVHIHNIDGRQFVYESPDIYDIIIINTPDPTTAVVNRYYTLEFFKHIKNRLAQGGLVAIGAVSGAPLFYAEPILKRNSSIYHTIKEQFRDVIVTPGAGSYFLASDIPGQISLNEDTILERMLARDITDVDISGLLQPSLIKKANDDILGAPSADYSINKDTKPIVYYFSIIAWLYIAGEEFINFLQILERPLIYVLAVPFIVILICVICVKFMLTKRNVAKAISIIFLMFTFGLFGITAEIIIILAFQNTCGYVYQYIGALIAFFMAGLGAGVVIVQKIFRPEKSIAGLLLLCTIAIVILGIFLFGLQLVGFMGSKAGFLVYNIANLIVGMVVGGAFSLANFALCQQGSALAAGVLYAFDIFGGCIGAIFVSCILLPIWGFNTTCVLLIAVMFTSLVCLLIGL